MISTAVKGYRSAPARSPPTRYATRYRFELAAPSDDEELRRLFAAIPMGGSVPLRFSREPNFFAALAVEGEFCQVIICRDSHNGRAVGIAVRAIRERYVNGRVVPVGYLSSLRFLPEYRGLGLLARGFSFLRELHADRRTEFYLTSIAAGNDVARQTLLGGRAGLPQYTPLESYETCVLRVACRQTTSRTSSESSRGISLQPARQTDLTELVQFWNSVGPERQFFPHCLASDFGHESGNYRGLLIEDVLVARREAEIVGTCGIWNQTAFRQIRIDRYSPWQSAMRPLYNVWSAATGAPALPAAGRPWPALLVALRVVASGDSDLFGALLDEQLRRIAGRGHTHLLVGLSERDALSGALARRRCVIYPTNVYLVAWEDAEGLRRSLDGRVAYLELGSL